MNNSVLKESLLIQIDTCIQLHLLDFSKPILDSVLFSINGPVYKQVVTQMRGLIEDSHKILFAILGDKLGEYNLSQLRKYEHKRISKNLPK